MEKSPAGSSALNLRQRKRYCYFCKETLIILIIKIWRIKKFVSDKVDPSKKINW